MKIFFDLEKGDIFKFQCYALLTNKYLRKLFLFLLAVHFFSAFLPFFRVLNLYFSGQFWGDVDATSYFAGIIGYCAYIFLISVAFTAVVSITVSAIHLFFQLNSYKVGDGSLGRHSLELDEEFLKEVTDVNETCHSWKSVQRIVERKTLYLIYVSPTNAHIIPKRAFNSDETANSFFEDANRLKEMSRLSYSPSYLASKA